MGKNYKTILKKSEIKFARDGAGLTKSFTVNTASVTYRPAGAVRQSGGLYWWMIAENSDHGRTKSEGSNS